MLISTTAQARIANANKKHYENLGYTGLKNGDIIEVPIEHLSKGSHSLVEYTCDYCGEILKSEYKNYLKSINQIIPKTACRKCLGKKEKESNIVKFGVPSAMCLKSVQEKAKQTTKEHYGVEYPSQNPEIINRVRQTNIIRYGVEHPSKTQEFQDKIKETRLEKYGVPYMLQLPEIQEKIRQTTLERYGVENASQSGEIKQKKKDTLLKHYGVEHGSQSPIIKEKMANSFYDNNSKSTSSQQKYICGLYNMTLNYPISYFNVDMCDIDNKLVCEYDGGGHRLSVKLGNISEKEFEQKEIIRNNIIKRRGYKMFRIISSKDKLPSDKILLEILDNAKEYFYNYPNHSWIEFDIDNSCIRNAEHKDGVLFDFGKIKYTR